MSRVFLYKDGSEDRDCCAYIKNNPMRFECGHYFGSVNLEGACYSGSKFPPYDEIRTALSKKEYSQLVKFAADISDLGYGIDIGSERYMKGVHLCKEIQPVYDKLLSSKNAKLFIKVQREEKEYLMDEHDLSEEDVDMIFENYALEYRDRGIVGTVFADSSELGYEEAFEFGYIERGNSIQERYFDYDKFGDDLAEDENHLLLSDGRVVSLNY